MRPIDLTAGHTKWAELRRELAEIDRRLSDLRTQLDDAEQLEGHLLGAINAARVERKRLEKALSAEPGAEVSEPARRPDRDRGAEPEQELPGSHPAADTLKEQVIHPFRSQRYERLRALDDVSLEVGKGEFSASPDRTAPARAPSSRSSPGSTRPTRAP